MDGQHMTQQEFSDFLNIAPATLSSILRGRTRPTLAIVDAIANRFPDISTDWLLFGKEPMMKSAAGAASESEGTGAATPAEPLLDFGDEASPTPRAAVSTSRQAAADSPDQLRTPQYAEHLDMVKKFDTKQRRITEIRIFYDDQTWETFVPKK